MTDSEGFLVLSDKAPSYRESPSKYPDSSYLANAYAFRPGLSALIKLGSEARQFMLKRDGKSDKTLRSALADARRLYEAGKGSDDDYYKAIRDLRNSIRNLKGAIPQADNHYLNLFRQTEAF